MRILFFLTLFLLNTALAQTEIKTQIHDIDMGRGSEEPLIFLTSGHVVTFPTADKMMLDTLREGLRKKSWYLFTVNEEREITHLEEVEGPVQIRQAHSGNKLKMLSFPYVPSVLKDMNQARMFFYEARTDHKHESQCYNRAHVWTYEWRTKKNLYSSKSWLFFTRRYIRKYKFEWWFHVAPMIHVVDNNEVKARVMDVKYARGPLSLKQWTNVFMRDNADCPVVEKYRDHADFPESGSCFLMTSPMYYYQPVDLEELDVSGTIKDRWFEAEVKNAYLEAFGVTLGEEQ